MTLACNKNNIGDNISSCIRLTSLPKYLLKNSVVIYTWFHISIERLYNSLKKILVFQDATIDTTILFYLQNQTLFDNLQSNKICVSLLPEILLIRHCNTNIASIVESPDLNRYCASQKMLWSLSQSIICYSVYWKRFPKTTY
jgi:hypothetical protein